MNAAVKNDLLAELIDNTAFRLLAGDFECIRRSDCYSAKSPFNRLLWIKKGGAGYIESAGNRLMLKPGHLVFIPAEVEATYIKPKGLEFYWVYFRADCFGCVDFFRLCSAPCLSRPDDQAIKKFRRMLANFREPRPANRIRVLMDLFSLLWPFFKYCRPNRSEEKHQQLIRLMPALSFIEEHLAEPIRLQDLAVRMALAPVYFSNLFSNAMEVPPIQYLNRRRIARAKELLLISPLSIKEIAAKTGFEDPLYFSRVFQKQEGMSPLHYRQTGFRGSARANPCASRRSLRKKHSDY
jgi:AraC-like DNA-binding protein